MNKLHHTLIGLTAASLLSACGSTEQVDNTSAIMNQKNQQAFDQCQRHVISMDKSAGKNASQAQYLASANSGLGCLTDVNINNPYISEQQIMQLHALTVLNFVRGGDIVQARNGLNDFVHNFRNKDLYFADNTSFIHTFGLLLNGEKAQANQSSLNVNKTLVAELKRKQTWLNR